MKELNLKLTGEKNLDNALVYIDGKQTTLKQNEFKNLSCKHQTEADKVKIEIYRALDVGGALWFITQLFFFIISIFGIFDIHPKNKYMALDFAIEVELKDVNNLTLRCNTLKDNAKAFEIESDSSVEELSNKFYVDASAKKKFKALLITKIVLAIAIIAAVIAVLIVKL